MQNFSNWFSRCTGSWVSHRRYLTLPARKDDSYKTEFTVKADGNNVSISWDGDASAGTMNMTIEEDMLKRDIGYFSKDPTDSRMEQIDDDTVVFHSEYDGMKFREEIRLLDNDNHRLRQTVGYKKGKPFLVGQYFEEKV
jgi:hypothetical protein